MLKLTRGSVVHPSCGLLRLDYDTLSTVCEFLDVRGRGAMHVCRNLHWRLDYVVTWCTLAMTIRVGHHPRMLRVFSDQPLRVVKLSFHRARVDIRDIDLLLLLPSVRVLHLVGLRRKSNYPVHRFHVTQRHLKDFRVVALGCTPRYQPVAEIIFQSHLSLEYLELHRVGVSGLETVTPRLRKLGLFICQPLEGHAKISLGDLSNVRALIVRNHSRENNIDFPDFSKIKSLRWMEWKSESGQVLTSEAGLTDLRCLVLAKTGIAFNVSKLRKLRRLAVGRSAAAGVYLSNPLPNLHFLTLEDLTIGQTGLFSRFPRLKTLSLFRCRLTTLDGLECCQVLTDIRVNARHCTLDLSALSACGLLETVELRNAKVVSVEPLLRCPSLNQVRVYKCTVPDLRLLENSAITLDVRAT